MSGLPGTARAFATYSLVPYLGIVFCPGAVVLGTLGVIRSYRSQQASDDLARGICCASTIVGVVVTAVQLLLWWFLYQAPMWANQF
ncbi:MAG TPA: hypothetical protein VK868_08295 [Pyrinomonadaceae bacterium]|nr:hypothetical protein [Pyrinomonadaceae bacterium]